MLQPQPQHTQAKARGLQPRGNRGTEGRRQASLQPTTGEKEHGSAIVGLWSSRDSSSSNLQASQQPATGSEVRQFQWEMWWQLVHTGCLPTGVVLNFVPPEYAAAFTVFHFTGMFGTSEAHAESGGGTLKRFAKSLSCCCFSCCCCCFCFSC